MSLLPPPGKLVGTEELGAHQEINKKKCYIQYQAPVQDKESRRNQDLELRKLACGLYSVIRADMGSGPQLSLHVVEM